MSVSEYREKIQACLRRNITGYEEDMKARRRDDTHEERMDGDPIYGFMEMMKEICLDLVEKDNSQDAIMGLTYAKYGIERWLEKLDNDDAWVEKEENSKELEKFNEGHKLIYYNSLKTVHSTVEKITKLMVNLDLTKVCENMIQVIYNFERNFEDAQKLIDDGVEKLKIHHNRE